MKSTLRPEDVVYRFDIVIESFHGCQPKEGCKYSVKWRRGDKWTGRTEQFTGSSIGIVVLNHKISFTSTMQQKDKTRYHKKLIEFFVNEHSVKKGKAEKHHVAELKADLADMLNVTHKTIVVHDKNDTAASLMISVTSAPSAARLGVPGHGGDADTHTDAGPSHTSVDGHSENDDLGTASIAEDSERASTPKVSPKPPDPNRFAASPRVSFGSGPLAAAPKPTAPAPPAPAPPTLRTDAVAVPSAIAIDTERRLREAEARVRTLEAERERLVADSKTRENGKQGKGVMDAHYQSLQTKLDMVGSQLHDAQCTAEEAQMHVVQLRKELEAKQLECQCLEEQISILSSENELLQEEVHSYKLQVDDQAIQIQQLSEGLQKQNSSQIQDFEELQAQLSDCQAQLEHTRQDARRGAQISTELRLLDPLVLWAVPCFVKDGAPGAALGLLLWLKDWNALGTANNRKDAPNTFLVNTIRALAHVVETKGSDSRTLLYWVSSLWWLLSLLDAEFPLCQVKRHVQSPSVLLGVREQLCRRQADRRPPQDGPVKEFRFPAPQFAGLADDLPVLTPPGSPAATAADGCCEPIVLRFATDLLLSAADALATLLDAVFTDLDGLVVPAVFPPSAKNAEKSGGKGTADLLQMLDGLFTLTIDNKLPGRVRDVIFQAVFSHISALIFNHFVGTKSLCKLATALHLKATVRELEKWQQERGMSKACRPCMAPVTQVANMLTVKKELLLEPSTRTGVCPALKVHQIHAILANYAADELDAEGVSPAIVAQLERDALALGPLPVLLPSQHAVADLRSPASPQDVPPYVSDWLPTIGDIAPLDPHSVELPRCLCTRPTL